MEKLRAHNVVLEVTRRCNIVCAHCLRGKMEVIDADCDTIRKFLAHFDRIGKLTITGGEPSLVPDTIWRIADIVLSQKIKVNQFFCATNGQSITNSFIQAIKELYRLAISNDSVLLVSNTAYHKKLSEYAKNKLMLYPFVKYQVTEDTPFPVSDVTVEGFGQNIEGASDVIRKEPFLCVGNNIVLGYLYLNCLGFIVYHCNLSYESQRNPDNIVCSVNDPEYLISIKKFAVE